MAAFVGEHMHTKGFRGSVGIDAMVVHTADGLRLVPILELNPRLTMGRIAVAMHKQMGLRGGWFFVSDAALRVAGYADRDSFVDIVHKTDGLVFTTEPTTAAHTLTVASVAQSWQQAVDQWTGIGMLWPSE